MNRLSSEDILGGSTSIVLKTSGAPLKPRILLDLLAYGPSDGGFATSIHALLDLATCLPEFEFGLLHHRDHRDCFSHWPITRHETVYPRPLKFLSSLWITPQVVQRYHYDAVHSDISLLSPWLGVPASIRVHDLYFLLNPAVSQRNPVKRIVKAIFESLLVRSIRRAAVVGAISECTRRDIGRLVGRTRGVSLLPHAIPQPSGLIAPQTWPEKDQTLRLLFVGSVVPRKNLPFLLRALALVKRPWTLDIAGNNWWGRDAIRKLAADSRVCVRGFVSDESLANLYRTSHCVVIPSLYEGFGLPAAEAINAGCLALTASGSGFDEYIPEKCRFDASNPIRLATLIESLDRRTAKQLWEDSRRAVARYTKEEQTSAYAATFRHLVDLAASRRQQHSRNI